MVVTLGNAPSQPKGKGFTDLPTSLVEYVTFYFYLLRFFWYSRVELNHQPLVYKTTARTIELLEYKIEWRSVRDLNSRPRD